MAAAAAPELRITSSEVIIFTLTTVLLNRNLANILFYSYVTSDAIYISKMYHIYRFCVRRMCMCMGKGKCVVTCTNWVTALSYIVCICVSVIK